MSATGLNDRAPQILPPTHGPPLLSNRAGGAMSDRRVSLLECIEQAASSASRDARAQENAVENDEMDDDRLETVGRCYRRRCHQHYRPGPPGRGAGLNLSYTRHPTAAFTGSFSFSGRRGLAAPRRSSSSRHWSLDSLHSAFWLGNFPPFFVFMI